MGETVEPHSVLHLPADIAHDLRRPLGVFREHHELLLGGIRDVQFVLRAEVVVIVVAVFRCDLKTRRVNWVMEKFYPKHTATTRVLRTRSVYTVGRCPVLGLYYSNALKTRYKTRVRSAFETCLKGVYTGGARGARSHSSKLILLKLEIKFICR